MTKDLDDAVRYGRRLVGRKVEADDLRQEVLLRLVETGRTLEQVSRPLLFTMVKAIAIDLVRKAGHDKRPGRRDADVPVAYQETERPSMGAAILRTTPSGQDVDTEALSAIEADRIMALVLDLPERNKNAMLLHLEGLSAPEIADHLGLKAQTVRKHLMEARDLLRSGV